MLVTAAPVSAYQVNAYALVDQAHASSAAPAAMPPSIAPLRTRVVSTPVRNAPSTGPAASDSTESPESRTDRVTHCAASATTICATPHPMVACRATRMSVSSSASGRTYFR